MKRGIIREKISNFKINVGNHGMVAAIRRRRGQFEEKRDDSQNSPPTNEEIDVNAYTLGDHMEYLHISKDGDNNYYSDVSHLLCDSQIPNLVKDFCSPIPENSLDSVYAGVQETTVSKDAKDKELLPVRTLVIRLRPDTSTTDVLDALQAACEDYGDDPVVNVLKRNQAHYRCLVLPNEVDGCLPFLVDADICMRRTGTLDRQLLLRLYHAGDTTKSTKQQRQKLHQNAQSYDEIMIPINLHLRGASSFLQYMSRQQGRGNPMAVPSPRSSPKASTAYFTGEYEPNFSVQLHKELKHVPAHLLFPSLNSDDWTLLQSSWTMVSGLIRNLTERSCLYHTIQNPVQGTEQPAEVSAPFLDLHYSMQMRQLCRDNMLAEVQSNFRQIKTNLDKMETSFLNFVHILKRALSRYKMPDYQATASPPPKLQLPPPIAPPGHAKLAATACKCAQGSPDDPTAIWEDAVQKTYKTFCSQDDHNSRKHLKDANNVVMARLVEIQENQLKLVRQVEDNPNAQPAAKQFCKDARQAVNSLGRVERLVLAKVPIFDFEVIGGRCQITSTAMLCRNDGVFYYFDLRAVDFRILSENCLAVVTSAVPLETIHKFYTGLDLLSLMEFLKTLQTLGGTFSQS